MRFFCILSMTILGLSACGGGATVSQHQCAAGDWETLGYRDGVNGYRSTQLLAHQDACVKHGIIPDRHGYMVGWDDGAREYCASNNAFSIGERGKGHNNICPTDLRANFLHAYQQGRSLYLARVAVANLERTFYQRTGRLEQVKAEIVATAAAQLNPVWTPAERIELLAKTKRLNDEKHQLQASIPQLEADLAIRARELDALSQTLAGVVH